MTDTTSGPNEDDLEPTMVSEEVDIDTADCTAQDVVLGSWMLMMILLVLLHTALHKMWMEGLG